MCDVFACLLCVQYLRGVCVCAPCVYLCVCAACVYLCVCVESVRAILVCGKRVCHACVVCVWHVVCMPGICVWCAHMASVVCVRGMYACVCETCAMPEWCLRVWHVFVSHTWCVRMVSVCMHVWCARGVLRACVAYAYVVCVHGVYHA